MEALEQTTKLYINQLKLAPPQPDTVKCCLHVDTVILKVHFAEYTSVLSLEQNAGLLLLTEYFLHCLILLLKGPEYFDNMGHFCDSSLYMLMTCQWNYLDSRHI